LAALKTVGYGRESLPTFPRGGIVRPLALLSVVAASALAVAAPASAQTVQDVNTIASGLDNPRHLAVSRDGDVYVAEAGRGGDPDTSKSCFDSAEGPACTGATGAVTRISRHHRGYHKQRVVRGLASFAPEDGSNAIGPHGIFVDGHSLLVTNGGPTAPMRSGALVLRDPTLVSEEPVSRLYGTLLEFSKGRRPKLVADIWRFERRFNPDEEVGNPLIDSNPVDVYSDRGRTVVADAGGNSLLRVGRHGSLRVVALFPNVDTPDADGAIIPMNAVPTGVVAGSDGAYYVSQLTGFPFPVGAAKVFRVNPVTGAFTDYATGFTNAMDLAFGRDGTLYVLEIDHNSLAVDGSEGALFAVPPGGGTPQQIALPAGTLTDPGGLAVGRHGDLYVSNHGTSAGTSAGGGEVLKIQLDD
jgi:hypothetical protein